MHWIDGVVVGIYFLGTILLGRWVTQKVHSSEDFFLAGRSLPFWAIGMSLVVSDIGALEMVGGSANAYLYGIGQANYEWIGCVPAMIVGGLLFVPIYWRAGVYSVPEYLSERYGSSVRSIQAGIWTIFLAASLAVFFQAAASMFETTFGWSQWFSVLSTAAVVSIYCVGGGLRAVVMTDVVQCIILFIGGLILAFLGLEKVGGFSGLQSGLEQLKPLTDNHLRMLAPVAAAGEKSSMFPWTGVMLGLGLVLSPAYWIGNQAIVQRVLAAEDEWSARASMIFGAILKTVVPLAFVLPGLIGLLLLGQDAKPDQIYPRMVMELLPVGVRGVLFAAFLAALMSSVDSYTNSAATIFVRDIYRRLPFVRLDDKKELFVGRICSFAIIAVGVALVPVVARYESIYVAFQQFLSYFQGPTLALLLFGFCWRGATKLGGLYGMLIGVFAALSFDLLLGLHLLHTAFWSFVVSAMVLVLVSLVTPRLPDTQLDRLVLVQLAKKGRS